MFNYNPENIEVGSIVSEKISPIFKDSIEVFNRINYFQNFIRDNKNINNKEKKQNIFLLIPNEKKISSKILRK